MDQPIDLPADNSRKNTIILNKDKKITVFVFDVNFLIFVLLRERKTPNAAVPDIKRITNTSINNINIFFYFICDHIAIKPILTSHLKIEKLKLMAERVGFEPTVPLTVHKLSKPAP